MKEVAEQEYAQAIQKAEKALLAGETVSNTQINGKSLVLQLFREHNIDLPLRTQGWVNHSLEFFSYKDSVIQVRYCGHRSESFIKAVDKLYKSVLRK